MSGLVRKDVDSMRCHCGWRGPGHHPNSRDVRIGTHTALAAGSRPRRFTSAGIKKSILASNPVCCLGRGRGSQSCLGSSNRLEAWEWPCVLGLRKTLTSWNCKSSGQSPERGRAGPAVWSLRLSEECSVSVHLFGGQGWSTVLCQHRARCYP